MIIDLTEARRKKTIPEKDSFVATYTSNIGPTVFYTFTTCTNAEWNSCWSGNLEVAMPDCNWTIYTAVD